MKSIIKQIPFKSLLFTNPRYHYHYPAIINDQGKLTIYITSKIVNNPNNNIINSKIENTNKIKTETEQSFFVDSKGFVSTKIILCDFNKQLITECIKHNIAHHTVIFNVFTKSKPLVVSGKSGIYAPTNSIYSDPEMALNLCKMMSKFVITVFAKEVIHDEKDLIKQIGDFLKISDQFEHMDKFYPIAQHMLNSLMANFKFSPTLLYEITKTSVNYDSYMISPISIATIIEAYVFKEVLLSFIQKNEKELLIIAQNPDNLKGDHTLYTSAAYNIMKQPNPDFRCENRLTQINKFYDCKLKGHNIKNIPTMKGILTLTPSLNEQDKLEYIKKTRADLGNINKTNTLLQKEGQLLIKQKILEIKQLELNKTLNIEQKVLLFNNIQNQIDLNPYITSVVCSRVVKTEKDLFFNETYNKNPEILIKLQKIANDIKILDLIAAQGQGHQIAQVGSWNNFCLKIVLVMPEHLKPLIYKNLFKMLTIEG